MWLGYAASTAATAPTGAVVGAGIGRGSAPVELPPAYGWGPTNGDPAPSPAPRAGAGQGRRGFPAAVAPRGYEGRRAPCPHRASPGDALGSAPRRAPRGERGLRGGGSGKPPWLRQLLAGGRRGRTSRAPARGSTPAPDRWRGLPSARSWAGGSRTRPAEAEPTTPHPDGWRRRGGERHGRGFSCRATAHAARRVRAPSPGGGAAVGCRAPAGRAAVGGAR